ncbi:MAG TPA: energy transducer TonB, partial [Blastocatellia bacterium]|nr:energy transducer TonB [Blastocatellia bacterium]
MISTPPRFRNVPAVIIAGLLLFLVAQAQAKGQSESNPKIIRNADGVFLASATKRVEPAYPPLAKAALISGAVIVEVTVDEEGKVIAARAISGHP